MPTPPLPKREAEQRIALVEECLKEGFVPQGESALHGMRTAVREAYHRANPTKSGGGASSWYNGAAAVLGREADWSLWVEKVESPGRAPFEGAVPEGFRMRGRSTLYAHRDGESEVVMEWVKTTADAEQQALMLRETLAAMAEDVPRGLPIPQNAQSDCANSDLLNLYVLTDYHFGMKAWHEEAGEDWDLDIAEELLIKWFAAAIAQSPKAETAILGQLGDLMHADTMEALTPTSKNLLDVDTRHAKTVRTVIRVIRQIITMLLEKYPTLHVIMADANHDPVSGIWLRELFSMHYEDEPRITVETSPEPYYCYEHGLTSLFFHHGHKRKVTNVDDVLAARFRDVFGRTKFSFAHMGHRHQRHVVESNLMIVEQHRTLAAKDAYAARGGWLSGRDASVITYSRKHGEVGRITLTPEMVT